MFLREKKTRAGGKTYGSYYQIVEGKRDEQGRVRQRVVKYLGKYPNRKQAARAAVAAGYSAALRPQERASIHGAGLEASGITRDPAWSARDGGIEHMNKVRRRLVNP